MDDVLASRLLRYAPSRTYLLEALHDAQELFGGWLPGRRGADRDLSGRAGGRRLRRHRVLRDVPHRAGRPQA